MEKEAAKVKEEAAKQGGKKWSDNDEMRMWLLSQIRRRGRSSGLMEDSCWDWDWEAAAWWDTGAGDVTECWIMLWHGRYRDTSQSRITSVFYSLCGIASLQIGISFYSTQPLCICSLVCRIWCRYLEVLMGTKYSQKELCGFESGALHLRQREITPKDNCVEYFCRLRAFAIIGNYFWALIDKETGPEGCRWPKLV